MTSSGSSGSQFHDRKFSPIEANTPVFWPTTICVRFNVPANISTVTSTKTMPIS